MLLQHVDQVTPADLIRVLSPEAVEYFASLELGEGFKANEMPEMCKFVRLGNIIYLGSTIEYGSLNRNSEGRTARGVLLHNNIATFALEQMTDKQLEERQAEIGTTRVLGMRYIVDAGRVVVGGANGKPVSLGIWGESIDFERANDTGRLRTIELAQAAVGANITVTDLDI